MRRRRTEYPDALTPREREVLELLREGLTNEQIAQRLGVSFATAKYHVGEILSKLGVSSREEAARWGAAATQRQWLGLGGMAAILREAPWALAGKTAAASVLIAGVVGLAVLAIGVEISDRDAAAGLGKIAYIQGGNLWIKDLPDGVPRRITDDGNYFQPEWSPSGEWLIVYRDHIDRDPEVFVISADGATQRELETPASWSPDEDRLAYQIDHLGARGSVVVEDADGANRVVVAESSGDKRIGTLLLPAWSPDGDWLAYRAGVPKVNEESSGRLAIFAVKADGSEERQLFAYDTPNLTLSFYGWSPDGRDLVLSVLDSPADRFDGIVPRPMVPVGLDGRSPASPQPELVIFDEAVRVPGSDAVGLVIGASDFEEPERVVLYEPATGNLTTLTDDDHRAIHPDWSSDGSQLAYSAAPVDESLREHSIWVSRADGTAPRRLTDDDAYRDEWPRWSADGTKILFARAHLGGDGNAASIWLLDVAATEVTKVAAIDPPSFNPLRHFNLLGSGSYHIQWGQVVAWWRGR